MDLDGGVIGAALTSNALGGRQAPTYFLLPSTTTLPDLTKRVGDGSFHAALAAMPGASAALLAAAANSSLPYDAAAAVTRGRRPEAGGRGRGGDAGYDGQGFDEPTLGLQCQVGVRLRVRVQRPRAYAAGQKALCTTAAQFPKSYAAASRNWLCIPQSCPVPGGCCG